jgi:2-dehydropantoate 2-reductase
MNICVVGAGAIGGWVAASLARAGETVAALTSRRPLDAITLREGENRETVPLGRLEGPADLLLIAVKAPALRVVAPTLAPLIKPDTIILPMLNGVPWWFVEGERLASVDPDGTIAAGLPANQLIGCVVHASCYRDGDEVVVKHVDKLIVGEPDGTSSERLARVTALLDRAGLRPDPTGNVRRAIWYKLWGNATINPLSALTRSTADKLLEDSDIRAFMAEAMDELAAVGAAIDCPIAESADDRMAVTARLGAFKSSMLQDVEARRPIELEALLGAPREIARRARVPTPQLDRLYAMTRLMAENLDLR